MTESVSPSPENEYHLRELNLERYQYLGALASINLDAKDKSWQQMYRERLFEIEESIIKASTIYV